MSVLDKSRLEVRLGDFAIGSATALSDPRLLTRVQDYRRMLAARMVPLDSDEIRQRLATSDYHVSKKVDGEFDVLFYDGDDTLLLNPGGTVRIGLPVLKEAAKRLRQAGVKRAMVAGELHYVRPDGKRARVHDVSRVARQPESARDLDALHFAAFDLLDVNGEPPAPNYDAVWKQLTNLFGKEDHVGLVESVALRDPVEVEKQFRKWVGQGEEGIVVRSDAAGMFKIKPRHTIDAAVIGFTEGTDDRQGLLHDLLLALMRPDGAFHILGRVGGGFTNEQRRDFLSDLKDMAVDSDYAEVNDQVAYQMVRPEWVIEISVLDLITETTRGAPINKMVLEWNGGAPRWQIIRRMPLVGLISPQFVRRREDKTINPLDLRLKQISDLVEIPLIDRDARQVALPKSSLVRREVYTRLFKGALMVRKLVMWETNKANQSEEYPEYVIHFTDFSPNRKTPLEREIRISNSRDQIGQLWDALKEENVKKGWELAGAAAPPAVAPAAVAPPAAAPTPVAPPAAEPVTVTVLAVEGPPAKMPRGQRKPPAEPVAETKAPAPAEAPSPEPPKKPRRARKA
jgi:ATP-dependent DNA ligase